MPAKKSAEAAAIKLKQDGYRCYELFRDLHRQLAQKYGQDAAKRGLETLTEWTALK